MFNYVNSWQGMTRWLVWLAACFLVAIVHNQGLVRLSQWTQARAYLNDNNDNTNNTQTISTIKTNTTSDIRACIVGLVVGEPSVRALADLVASIRLVKSHFSTAYPFVIFHTLALGNHFVHGVRQAAAPSRVHFHTANLSSSSAHRYEYHRFLSGPFATHAATRHFDYFMLLPHTHDNAHILPCRLGLDPFERFLVHTAKIDAAKYVRLVLSAAADDSPSAANRTTAKPIEQSLWSAANAWLNSTANHGRRHRHPANASSHLCVKQQQPEELFVELAAFDVWRSAAYASYFEHLDPSVAEWSDELVRALYMHLAGTKTLLVQSSTVSDKSKRGTAKCAIDKLSITLDQLLFAPSSSSSSCAMSTR